MRILYPVESVSILDASESLHPENLNDTLLLVLSVLTSITGPAEGGT